MESETPDEHAGRRRMALLALLHQRPHSEKEIIAALDKQDVWVYDRMADPSIVANQQHYQFRRDLLALRRSQWQIRYDKRSKCYAWDNSPFKLSLNPEQITVLATLHQTFAQKTMPYSNDIQELLSSFIQRLPDQQQKALVKQKRLFHIDLQEKTDYGHLDEKTRNEVERAILCGQQLEFSYKSPRKGQEIRHVIEPEPLQIKDGHVYLYGWSLRYENSLQFRLDYIVPGTAKMLHTTMRQNRPQRPTYTLRYHLTPTIARNSVSQYFPHPQQTIEHHPDGSATVTTQITDLLETRRILLSYGEHCTIDSPPELVKQMGIIATDFAQKYPTAKP